jgi:hypothetical protein
MIGADSSVRPNPVARQQWCDIAQVDEVVRLADQIAWCNVLYRRRYDRDPACLVIEVFDQRNERVIVDEQENVVEPLGSRIRRRECEIDIDRSVTAKTHVRGDGIRFLHQNAKAVEVEEIGQRLDRRVAVQIATLSGRQDGEIVDAREGRVVLDIIPDLEHVDLRLCVERFVSPIQRRPINERGGPMVGIEFEGVFRHDYFYRYHLR